MSNERDKSSKKNDKNDDNSNDDKSNISSIKSKYTIVKCKLIYHLVL